MKATMRDAAPAADLAANPLLLSIEESAAQLRIGRSRMFDLIRRGEVLSVKVGGSRRIPYDSLKAYVTGSLRSKGLRTATSPPPDLPAPSPQLPLPRGVPPCLVRAAIRRPPGTHDPIRPGGSTEASS